MKILAGARRIAKNFKPVEVRSYSKEAVKDRRGPLTKRVDNVFKTAGFGDEYRVVIAQFINGIGYPKRADTEWFQSVIRENNFKIKERLIDKKNKRTKSIYAKDGEQVWLMTDVLNGVSILGHNDLVGLPEVGDFLKITGHMSPEEKLEFGLRLLSKNDVIKSIYPLKVEHFNEFSEVIQEFLKSFMEGKSQVSIVKNDAHNRGSVFTPEEQEAHIYERFNGNSTSKQWVEKLKEEIQNLKSHEKDR